MTAQEFAFTPADDVAKRTREFFTRRGQSFSHLVNWLTALDGRTVLCKDGSMLSVIALDGLDLDSNSSDVYNAVRGQVAYAIEAIQPAVVGWQVRREVTSVFPGGDLPDEHSRAIYEAMQADFAANPQYTNRVYCFLLIPPPGADVRLLEQARRLENDSSWLSTFKGFFQIMGAAASGEGVFPYANWEEIQAALERAHQLVDRFVASMSTLGARVLHDEDLGHYLEIACSPTTRLTADVKHGLSSNEYLPESIPQCFIDNSLAEVLRFEWNGRQRWAQTITLDFSKVDRIDYGLFDRLMAAPVELVLTHLAKLLPTRKAAAEIHQFKTYHANRKYGVTAYLAAAVNKGDMSNAPVNKERAQSAEEAEELAGQVGAQKEGVALYHGCVMVVADTVQQLAEDVKVVQKILEAKRLRPRLESLHKLSSFAASIPGGHAEVALWDRLTFENVADLCPARTIFEGDRVNPYLTEQLGEPCDALLALRTKHLTPCYFTGYVGDVGHAQVIGGTGTGKTLLVNLIWTMFRKYRNARVACFDRDYSTRPAILLQGGQYLDFSKADDSPLAKRLGPIRALLGGTNPLQHLEFIIQWLCLLARQRGYQATGSDLLSLEQNLRSVIELNANTPDLLDLSTVVAQCDKNSAFAQALVPWTKGQVFGRYFDNAEDHFDLANLTGIEMGGVLDNEDVAVPFMSYVFYRIKTTLRAQKGSQQHGPMFIYIPESRYFLRNAQFRAEVEDWLATVRKLDAAVWFDTQSPESLVNSGIFSAFRDNLATMVFTPNKTAGTGSLAAMYMNEFGLTPDDLAAIAGGIAKRDYLIKQGHLTKQVSVSLPPEVVNRLRSDKRAQLALERHYRPGNPGWAHDYLNDLNNIKESRDGQ